MRDWLSEIHSSHAYFYRKTGLSPNTLLIGPVCKVELQHQVFTYKTFTLCDLSVTKFMGCEVVEVLTQKDFVWAFTVTE